MHNYPNPNDLDVSILLLFLVVILLLLAIWWVEDWVERSHAHERKLVDDAKPYQTPRQMNMGRALKRFYEELDQCSSPMPEQAIERKAEQLARIQLARTPTVEEIAQARQLVLRHLAGTEGSPGDVAELRRWLYEGQG